MPSFLLLQAPPPAFRDAQCIVEGLSQTLGEETEFPRWDAREDLAGVGEELATHAELDGLGGVREAGDGAVAVVGDQVAGLAFGTGPGEEAERVRHATSSPWIQYGPGAS